MSFDPSNRTYHLNDERMQAFRKLTPVERLRWVEELAQFLRLAKVAREQAAVTAQISQALALILREVISTKNKEPDAPTKDSHALSKYLDNYPSFMIISP